MPELLTGSGDEVIEEERIKSLDCSRLFNSNFTTIVSASGAYSVINVPRTAVRADCQCGF